MYDQARRELIALHALGISDMKAYADPHRYSQRGTRTYTNKHKPYTASRTPHGKQILHKHTHREKERETHCKGGVEIDDGGVVQLRTPIELQQDWRTVLLQHTKSPKEEVAGGGGQSHTDTT